MPRLDLRRLFPGAIVHPCPPPAGRPKEPLMRRLTLPRIVDALLDRYHGLLDRDDLAVDMIQRPDLVREILTTTFQLAALDAEQALRRPLLRERLQGVFDMSFTPDCPHDDSDTLLALLAETMRDYADAEAALAAGYARLVAAERALRCPDTLPPDDGDQPGRLTESPR